MCVVISCETAGRQIPDFLSAEYDPATLSNTRHSGPPDSHALFAAEFMATRIGCPFVNHRFAPALINVHKNVAHRQLIPKPIRRLRRRLISTVYQPYQDHLHSELSRVIEREQFVVHLSVRSFRSRNDRGQIRRGDVGLAYDPKDDEQMDLALDWADQMYDDAWMLKVRRNSPHSGTVESIVDLMRQRTGDGYIGLGVYLNRNWISHRGRIINDAIARMSDSLARVLEYQPGIP